MKKNFESYVIKIIISLLTIFSLPAIAEISSETLTKAGVGDPKSQHEVGFYYLHENNEENHLQIAKDWLEKSAKQKYAPSLYELGYMTMMSKAEDAVVQGVALMNLAAEIGYAEAQYQIGLIHGIRGEHTEAVDLFEKAAKQEHTKAMVLLAD